MLGQPKKYKLGIITSKSFTASKIYILGGLLDDKLDKVEHIHTNDVDAGCRTIISYCLWKKIPFTIWPIIQTFSTNNHIIGLVDFVYIIREKESKSADEAVARCIEKGVKHKIIIIE